MRLPAGFLFAAALIGGALASPVTEAQTTISTLGSGFAFPQGIAVHGGNVFVADGGNAAAKEITPAGGSFSITTLASAFTFTLPQGIAVDSSGNVFVGDTQGKSVYEILAAGGYTTVNTLGSGFTYPYGVAVDGSGNVFVADTMSSTVQEILAAGGYTTVNTIGSGFSFPTGVAVDGKGNVFVADAGNNAIKEILAASGYTTVNTLGSGFNDPNGVAVDGSGNVFVADTYNNAVKEILAAGGYVTVNTIANGFFLPTAVAVDGSGDVFVADTFNNAVKEIVAAPVVLAASVLPDSRSVQVGKQASIFATMINSGTSNLTGCQVSLPPFPPFGLTLSYQTTNPTTNAVTGTPNTPATIPANNGSQSFFLAFQGTAPLSEAGFAPNFNCMAGGTLITAPVFPGVNTVDLFISSTPVADVIALAATSTNDGTVHLSNGSGSFAIASDNVGAATAITAAIDYNGATLPVSAQICPSNPATGVCLLPPASTVAIANFTTGSTPTFSVYLTATGSIPFQPASSRVYFRFFDATGAERGATSVAITTQ
jgi:sugar lactone lactonase YvrE